MPPANERSLVLLLGGNEMHVVDAEADRHGIAFFDRDGTVRLDEHAFAGVGLAGDPLAIAEEKAFVHLESRMGALLVEDGDILGAAKQIGGPGLYMGPAPAERFLGNLDLAELQPLRAKR